jgi:CheY-like chemotaxis protein
MLEKEGIVFRLVDNGLECTQLIENEDFDLILMDIHMPVMDGVEASKIIRNSAKGKVANIPIIALTANVMSDDIAHYLSIGINAHIAKPTQPKDLHNTIVKCLKNCSDYFDKIA